MKIKPAKKQPGLPVEKLRWQCDPARIPWDTTAQAEPLEGVIGQDRAIRALKMGVELAAPGYNVFVCGLAGTSRGGMIVRMIEELQPDTPPSPDRCYVNNFIRQQLQEYRPAAPAHAVPRPGQRLQEGFAVRHRVSPPAHPPGV
ncbi:MAG: AAA family ATPase [Acidobacteria bacterium]|nr:AAA family ATPase [Acidobacteriota bacterium]